MAASSSSLLMVALIQMRPESLEPDRNFATAAQHIRSAAQQGASLAVLPEYHLFGWEPESPRFKAIAATAHTYLARYQALAKECQIHIVPGTIVTLVSRPDADDLLLNQTYFISSTGEILGEYTKANLWHPERAHLTSGPDYRLATSTSSTDTPSSSHHTVIPTPLGPVGLLICYDLAFPEAFRALVHAGARIIIIPTYTKSDDMSPLARKYNPHGEALFVQAALTSRAFENTCAVVFCNVGGPEEEGFMGLSQVVLPIVGRVEGGFTGAEEGVKVVGIDLEVLDVAEGNYRIREDLGREGWHYA